jgi:hypothetical protein
MFTKIEIPVVAWLVDSTSPFFEIARLLVRLDHVASLIVNANHGVMCTAAVHRVAD